MPEDEYSAQIDYKREIFNLSDMFRKLKEFSSNLDAQSLVKAVDQAIGHLHDWTFRIAIVGEFNRGKSTLVNALLGQDIAPCGILPMTATINRVTYGLKPSITVYFKDGREEDILLDRLTDFVTKNTQESEAVAKTVREVVIAYPLPFCQNGVDIVDTPGLSDDTETDAITLSILPQMDAAVLVMMAEAPFSDSERRFLEESLLRGNFGRVFFVVTGMDRCHCAKEGDRVVGGIEKRIKKCILQAAESQLGKGLENCLALTGKTGDIRVFGLSGHLALKAKLSGDGELLARSGFAEFEAALLEFLNRDRGAALLQVNFNRVIRLAAQFMKEVQKAIAELGLRESAAREKYQILIDFEARRRSDENAQKARNGSAHRRLSEIRRDADLIFDSIHIFLKQTANQVLDQAPVTEYDLNPSKLPLKLNEIKMTIGARLATQVRMVAGRLQLGIRKALVLNYFRESKDLEATMNELLLEIGSEMNGAAVALEKAIQCIETNAPPHTWIKRFVAGKETLNTLKADLQQNTYRIIDAPSTQRVFANIQSRVGEILEYLRNEIATEDDRNTVPTPPEPEREISNERELALIEIRRGILNDMLDQSRKIASEAHQVCGRLRLLQSGTTM